MRAWAVLAAALLAPVGAASPAQAGAVTVAAVDAAQAPATAGSRPLARLNVLREAPDGSGRLFLNDLRGPLHILRDGAFSTFLDLAVEIPALKTAPGLGQGFVSFALDPEFATSGLFYTVHTEEVGATPPNHGPPEPVTILHHAVLTEWQATDPAADVFSGTRRELIRVAAGNVFHNMGEIAFDPYAAPGDPDYRLLFVGGGDYGAFALGRSDLLQRLDTVWGAVLRIDPLGGPFERGGVTYPYGIPPDNPYVDGVPDTLDEIFVHGVRNTHRLSWDPATGLLFGTDIGEDTFEEINILRPGRNYGWPLHEGAPVAGASPELTDPVAVYSHAVGRAIAGGFPYRGVGIPQLAGSFLFGDIVNGALFRADLAALAAADDGDPATLAPVETVDLVHEGSTTTLLQVIRDALGDAGVGRADLRFGIDAGGELFLTTKQDGFLRRLQASAGSGPGRTPATLRLAKLSGGGGGGDDVRLSWNAPACSGWTDFAVYEGALGDWTGAAPRLCTDANGDRVEALTPLAGDRFFLVVPLDAESEGSFGLDGARAERVWPGAGGCRPVQSLTCL